ncbi:EAL and HDOD domain-containing protein [Methylotenera sp.]|uniref:EAL and HDOD domain-containing protein n=1 Tax=Methylotenera sp. TaxID=2051956 RepID=UPI00272F3E47|nr:EAL domain-containing protein [Methylotenera sp.]MDP2071339.1 EAL domain-containing protein [Methylotenera sp.]MDP2229804.1 EAL domain-containing protein [Methylotenera sp.]MDP3006371.1 EAL domain-containing protein [Methylotenera sp.]MDP3140431.1 EAL domain-containing protein [Methylotenera sp.]
MEDQAYIGRQPIMDEKQQIIGYELFFRHSADAESAVFEDEFKAYSSVLMNTIGGVDIQWLLGDKLAFINVNEAMLKSEFIELMPPQRTVLEVLRSINPSAETVERCQSLREQGYKIALDNPQLSTEASPLLQCADYIKIDIQSLNSAELQNTFTQLHVPSVKMIAEKVETDQQFEDCKRIGFRLFQGFHFARPETFTAKVINASFDSVLNILNTVSQDAEINVIEAGFKKDTALSFKLLRYINSVGFGLSFEIQSINHALTILGRKQLYRWLTLLMVTAGENSTPPALMKTSITRGRLTELLGETYFEKHDRDNLFIVGVFSLLDAILKMPMDKVLDKIQLPETVTEALLTREGIYGPFLQLTEACEDANSEKILELAELLQFDANKVNECHISALAWVETLGI